MRMGRPVTYPLWLPPLRIQSRLTTTDTVSWAGKKAEPYPSLMNRLHFGR